MYLRKEKQEEEVMIWSEEERMSVKRTGPAVTRPAESEKEKELEERGEHDSKGRLGSPMRHEE